MVFRVAIAWLNVAIIFFREQEVSQVHLDLWVKWEKL